MFFAETVDFTHYLYGILPCTKGGMVMKLSHVISYIVASKLCIIMGICCIVAVNHIFSQKWLDAISSQETVQADLKATCDGVDKVVYCKEQINRLNSNGQTGLMVQARLGRLLDVQELLAYKADPNIISTDPMRTTALHLACQSVDFVDGERIALLLLANGAKARIKDAHGNIPLHDLLSASSAIKKQKIASRMITAHKVDINVQNNDGDTPLHIAVTKNDLDWVTYIVNKFPQKIKFTLKNNLGYTPLTLAEFYGYDQLVDVLKKAVRKQQIAGGLLT